MEEKHALTTKIHRACFAGRLINGPSVFFSSLWATSTISKSCFAAQTCVYMSAVLKKKELVISKG